MSESHQTTDQSENNNNETPNCEEDIEIIRNELDELIEVVNQLEQKKISSKLKDIASKQEETQIALEKVTKMAEEMFDYAYLEINSPTGILSKEGKITKHPGIEVGKFGTTFNKIIVGISKLLAVLIWLIFGFYTWGGLLFRTIIVYAGVTAASNYSNSSNAKAEQRLFWVSGMYIRGFKKIIDSSKSPPLLDPADLEEDWQIAFGRLFGEIIKSTLTYAVFFPSRSINIIKGVIDFIF